MLELAEIEELFKSEELYKAKNRAALQALLRNAALLHREDVTLDQKKMALENIKAITNPQPKVKKQKQISVAEPKQATTASPERVKLKYSPIYEKYGVTKQHWDNPSSPDAHQSLFNFHNEVMAGKHPEFAHVKQHVEQAQTKVKKSIDSLYNLFVELKKNI